MMRPKPIGPILLYALSIFLVSASNFATAPLLIWHIGEENFGIWAQIEPLILLAIPLAGLGINIGYLNAHGGSGNMAGALFPAHMIWALCAASVIATVLIALGNPPDLAGLAFAIILFEGAILFLIAFWRASQQPLQFALFEGGRSFLVVALVAFCAVYFVTFPNDTEGYLTIRAAIAVMALGAGYLSVRWPLALDWAEARRAMRYGLPIVTASAAAVVIMNFDRYGVSLTAGTVAVATYVAHVKLSQILGSAVAPFYTWFAPVAIAKLKSSAVDHDFFDRAFQYFFAVTLSFALGLWLIAPLLWGYLFPTIAFEPALFLILLMGMVVFACGNPLSIGSLIEGRTMSALKFTTIAVMIGAIATLILGPRYGMEGVAAAKLLAMGGYTFLFATDTIKALNSRYNFKKIFFMLIICTILAIIGSFAKDTIISMLLISCMFPGFLILFSIFLIKAKI